MGHPHQAGTNDVGKAWVGRPPCLFPGFTEIFLPKVWASRVGFGATEAKVAAFVLRITEDRRRFESDRPI